MTSRHGCARSGLMIPGRDPLTRPDGRASAGTFGAVRSIRRRQRLPPGGARHGALTPLADRLGRWWRSCARTSRQREFRCARPAPKIAALRSTLHLPRLLVLLGIIGCAVRGVPPAVTPAASVSGGTIVSIRMVSGPERRGPWRGTLLAEVGVDADDNRTQAEFIVRQEDGSMLSIVQPNEHGFRTGEHVIIRRGPWTRLARPD